MEKHSVASFSGKVATVKFYEQYRHFLTRKKTITFSHPTDKTIERSSHFSSDAGVIASSKTWLDGQSSEFCF